MIARDGEPEPIPASSVRVFVAIKLMPEIARELAQIGGALERFGVRSVAADDMHLTLVAPWQEESITNAIDMLRQAAAEFGAFALDVQHVGYGPDARRPRLLWADCATVGELEALRAALLAVYGQTDERPYRPHVTLARIRGDGRAIARKQPIDRPVAFRQWVESVELFRSPSPGECGYQVLASAPLTEARKPKPDR